MRLYNALLSALAPEVGDVSSATAEEIRAVHLTRLGVRRETSEDLTRQFEAARYSSHPMGTAEATSFRDALTAAEEDLRRGIVAG